MNRRNIKLQTRVVALLLLVCAVLVPAAQVEAAVTFDEANRAFAEGRFKEAAKDYEALIAQKGYSAQVLFNLGNAYFRDGQVGAAILNYERAQLLAPNDPDVVANLNFARRQAGLFVERSTWIEEAARFFSMNAWAALGTAALILLCGLIAAAQFYPQHRLYVRLFTGVAALALCAAVTGIVLQLDTLDRAVVTSQEAVARISPFDAAKSAFVLSAGEVVDIEKQHGDFLYVENRQNRSGWVSKEQVQPVVPGMEET